MTKQEIIADEPSFQRVCGAYVSRHIGPCVSSLMYDVGQNLEECSRIFDFDYDEAINWFQVPDYESAVSDFVDEAEFDQLEWIWNEFGRLEQPLVNEIRGDDVTDEQIEKARTTIKTIFPDNAEEIAQHFNLEPYQIEIYEYWNIDSNWFADELKKYGQVVFEFGGLTIWGRMTTGQAISIDGVIRRMIRDLSEDHWVWSAVK